jgi:hypothetical protein
MSCSITCFLSCFLKVFLLIKLISHSYIAGLQTLLLGPKNVLSKVVGTPASDVMAEYTSLGVSLSLCQKYDQKFSRGIINVKLSLEWKLFKVN